MIVYRYWHGKLEETIAERETPHFWYIDGRRVAKVSTEYPDMCWYPTIEKAIKESVTYWARQRDDYLKTAQRYQEKIDEAVGLSVESRRYQMEAEK